MNVAARELAMFASHNHPMTYTDAVVSSIVGVLGIATGTLNDKFNYLKDSGGVGRPAPVWFGRVMFIGVGKVFLIAGMHYFFFEQ